MGSLLSGEFVLRESFSARRARAAAVPAAMSPAARCQGVGRHGLPPLIIQAGTHEVLLDDAVRLARQAATADVQVTLDITPGVPHVFKAYYPILDEAAAALDRAGQLLSAHLAGAERGTA